MPLLTPVSWACQKGVPVPSMPAAVSLAGCELPHRLPVAEVWTLPVPHMTIRHDVWEANGVCRG